MIILKTKLSKISIFEKYPVSAFITLQKIYMIYMLCGNDCYQEKYELGHGRIIRMKEIKETNLDPAGGDSTPIGLEALPS